MNGRLAVPQPPSASASNVAGTGAKTRGRALVIDHHWPEPDRDSGSVDIVNLALALGHLGFDVVLAATEEPAGSSPARAKLEALGIRCLQPELDGTLEPYLARHGAQLDLCVLCRVYCGGAFLETVQRSCGRARIVFNSIDLNFLREERRAKMLNDERLLALLPDLRAREEHIIRESDATILVSEAEMELVRETIPEAFCLTLPLARPILTPVTPFADRRGIGFIGGFAHAPNVDAISTFMREIWPLVLETLPECELSIVGAGFPQSLLDGCTGRVTTVVRVAACDNRAPALRRRRQGQSRLQPRRRGARRGLRNRCGGHGARSGLRRPGCPGCGRVCRLHRPHQYRLRALDAAVGWSAGLCAPHPGTGRLAGAARPDAAAVGALGGGRSRQTERRRTFDGLTLAV